MEKIRNLSFRKTIVVYIAIALFISFVMSMFIVNGSVRLQKNIWRKYIDEEKFYNDFKVGESYDIVVDIPKVDPQKMGKTDAVISEVCDFLESWIELILPMISCIIAMFLFYRNKIRIPLNLLVESSEHIAQNQLEFNLHYEITDEMGDLCKAFEKMRKQLLVNNTQLWKMVEQERDLKAAIAHDIRSPLSVLKGYQEILLEFIPKRSKVSDEKIMEVLNAQSGQIERLNHFINTMQKLNKLDDIQIVPHKVESKKLKDQLEILLKTVSADRGIQWFICADDLNEAFFGDMEIIIEVCDNLISNAVRYAKKEVIIKLEQKGKTLCIEISDDGDGFTQDIQEVTKAYYHSNLGDDLNHFGLGLYLSKMYCEKHGGQLLIGNNNISGAHVKACFKVEYKKD